MGGRVVTIISGIAGLALATLVGCAGSGPAQRQDITPQQLQTMLTEGGPLVLLDVRTAEEYAGGHIEGAINRPVGEIETWWSALDPQARTVCICQLGGRSQTAADTLVSRGFSNVYNVLGGMDAWPGATVTGNG